MQIKIDGQTITLTDAQAQQFRKAILKETSEQFPPVTHGQMTLACKQVKSAYPMVVCLDSVLYVQQGWECGLGKDYVGRDFNAREMRCFIKELQDYARKVWPWEKF